MAGCRDGLVNELFIDYVLLAQYMRHVGQVSCQVSCQISYQVSYQAYCQVLPGNLDSGINQFASTSFFSKLKLHFTTVPVAQNHIFSSVSFRPFQAFLRFWMSTQFIQNIIFLKRYTSSV